MIKEIHRGKGGNHLELQPWLFHSYICLGIALVSFLLSIKMLGKIERSDSRYLTSVTFGFFWVLFGVSYLFTGLSIATEFLGASGLSLSFFYASFASILMMTSPLAYFIMHILLGDRRISVATSLGFAVIGLVSIMLLFTIGIENPYPDVWIPLYSIDPLLKNLFLFGLFAPSFGMILGLLPFIALRRAPKLTKYKVTMALISLSLIYDITFFFGILGVTGLPRLVSNLFILLGALLGYAAFFPPNLFIRGLKLEEQKFEEYLGDEEQV